MGEPRTLREPGRARIVAVVVLVLAIAVLGAILGPRLIHESAHPESPTGLGLVCLEVPTDTGLPRGGGIRLAARGPGRPPLEVTETIPAHARQDAVVLLLADAAAAQGWTSKEGIQPAGHCLTVGRVTEVGGDPGGTGAVMSFGLAGETRAPARFRLRLEGRAGPADATLRLGLTARGILTPDVPDVPTAETEVTTRLTPAAEVLATLLEHLASEGWTAETDPDGSLVLRTMPRQEPLSGVLVTVEYVAAEDGRVPVQAYRVSVGLAP